MAKKRPPELDPILPLPAGTGIPPVEQGRGREIMENDTEVVVVMSYRAMYFLWEHAERMAAKEYPKYVGGPHDMAAQVWLDAVYAFRSAAQERAGGMPLKRYSEAKAKKAREILARIQKREKSAQKDESAAQKPQRAKSKARKGKGTAKKSKSSKGPSKGSQSKKSRKPRSKARS